MEKQLEKIAESIQALIIVVIILGWISIIQSCTDINSPEILDVRIINK